MTDGHRGRARDHHEGPARSRVLDALQVVATLLLAVGFVAVATGALMLSQPTPDANIGAGILLLAGIPVGALGLLLLLVALVVRLVRGSAAARGDAHR